MDDGPGSEPPPDPKAIPDAQPRSEPLHPRANRPYVVFGRNYQPMTSLQAFRQRGFASWYGRKFHGQRTSSGEVYDMYAMTAAHPTLPIPSYARVTNLRNGEQVVVRVNDRGPFLHNRVIDLSFTAASKLGYVQAGSAEVEVELLTMAGTPPSTATLAQAAVPVPAPGAASGASSVTAPLQSFGQVQAQSVSSEPIAQAVTSVATAPETSAATASVRASTASTVSTASSPSSSSSSSSPPSPSMASNPGSSAATNSAATPPAREERLQVENLRQQAEIELSRVPAARGVAVPQSGVKTVSTSGSVPTGGVPRVTGPASANAPVPAASAAQAGASSYLQLAAFNSSESAESTRARVSKELDWLRAPMNIVRDGALFKLQVGPFASRDEAREAADRVKRATGSAPFLLMR